MEIVHIAAELAPIAKVGGLGDVVHGLSRATNEQGRRAEVILPFYDTLAKGQIHTLTRCEAPLPLEFDGKPFLVSVWKGKVDGIEVTFLESKQFFERGMIYGCADDATRFAFFSLAAVRYLLQSKKNPSLLHLHDWHTSLVAPLACRLLSSKIVLTIHNLSYQGKCDAALLKKVGLHTTAEMEDPLERGCINLLKTGILYSDYVTTVSPGYHREILEGTDPLGAVLRGRKERFKGILNGIDTAVWNPSTDPYLPVHFSQETVEKKEEAKRRLRAQLGLAEENTPLVCAITRLVAQKGPDLIKQALYRTLERGGQFVFLGSAPDGDIYDIFMNLKKKLSGSPHVHIELAYNEALSRLVFGAADLFLVPSLFEPCGLTQLIAMRYGAVPLVRRTGGLGDTVFDGVNGFTFDLPTLDAIQECIDRAFWCWFKEPEKWKRMRAQGMRADHSWNSPIQEYFTLYDSLNKSSKVTSP